jgi:hypothetical protein
VKLRRTLLIALAVVLLAAGGVAAWLYRSIDGIVARAIERSLSQTTGTKCSVGSVSVKLRTGEGVVRRLRIGNPHGFSPVSAVEIEEVRFDLDVATLRKQPVVVESVQVAASQVHFEVDPAGKANLDEIRRHAAGAPADPNPTRIRIHRLDVAAGTIEADLSAVGGKTEHVDLDAFTMSDVGGRDGATPDVIAKALVSELTSHAAKAVAREGLTRELERRTGGLGGKLRGLFGK